MNSNEVSPLDRSLGKRWLPSNLWAFTLLGAVARALFASIYFKFSGFPPLLTRLCEDVAIAQSLISGHGYGSPFFVNSGPTAFIAPGYPLFLALVIKIFGTGSISAAVVILCQETFSLLTLALALCVARRHFGKKAANFAGLICALAPPMLAPPLLIWDTAFSALAVTGFLVLASTLRLARCRFIPAGAACALVGLTNPSLLPSLFALCGWVAWKTKKVPWAGIVTFCLLFSPWPIRNAVVMHAFIPFRSNFGFELWLGNHPGGDGGTDPSLSPWKNPAELRAFVDKGELAYMAERGEMARRYIADHPARFLALTLSRVSKYWALAGDGFITAVDPIFALAIPGFLLLAKRKSEYLMIYLLPLLLFPLPYYFTHTDTRFRSAIDPLLTILAAYSISAFLSWIRPKSRSADESIAHKEISLTSSPNHPR